VRRFLSKGAKDLLTAPFTLSSRQKPGINPRKAFWMPSVGTMTDLKIRSLWTFMKDMCGKVKGKHEFYLGMMSSVTFPLTLKVCACMYLCMLTRLHIHTCTDSSMYAVKITSLHRLFTHLTDLQRTQSQPS